MNKRVVIFGDDKDGSYGEVAYALFTEDSDYQVEAFTVHEQYLIGRTKTKFGTPFVPFESVLSLYPANEFELFVALDSSKMNSSREYIFTECKRLGYKMASYIHSNVFMWKSVKVGEHVAIFANNEIDPYVEIGNNVVIWGNNHIGHRTKICDNVFISSGVSTSGSCLIGNNCFVGVNASLAERTILGPHTFIGMGVAVWGEVNEGSVIKPHKFVPEEYNTNRLRGLE